MLFFYSRDSQFRSNIIRYIIAIFVFGYLHKDLKKCVFNKIFQIWGSKKSQKTVYKEGIISLSKFFMIGIKNIHNVLLILKM